MFFDINMEALTHSINLLWQGMLGIFVGMVTIALSVLLFTHVPSLFKKK